MGDIGCMLRNIDNAYHGSQNLKTKTVTVYYDDKNIRDEEKTFVFNPDGSASSVSHAWGVKDELPPGTLSDVMLKLPETEVLNAQLARNLVNEYYAHLKKDGKGGMGK